MARQARLDNREDADEAPPAERPGSARSEDGGPSPSAAPVKILRVKSKSQRGFHRCGRHFTPQGVDIPIESLQPEQVKALQAEPQLTAEIVEQK